MNAAHVAAEQEGGSWDLGREGIGRNGVRNRCGDQVKDLLG